MLRFTFEPWSGNIDDRKAPESEILLYFDHHSLCLYLSQVQPQLISEVTSVSQPQMPLNIGQTTQLVYRPCPAELRGSASHPTAQARVIQQNTGSSGHPPPFATATLANQQGFKYGDRYPIENHAGPMLIHDKQNTFCGICGMCITLEDEQAVSRVVSPFTTSGPSVAQHDDAGNEEFEELQQGEDQSVDCAAANERKLGVMPRPGWTGMYRVGRSIH